MNKASEEKHHPPGRWPLKRWCINLSWMTALVALLLLCLAPLWTLIRGDHVPGLWLIPPAWAAGYGLIFAMAYGMGHISQDMPPSSFFGNTIPPVLGHMLDTLYGTMANIVLIIFPLGMVQMAIFILIVIALS